MPGTLYIVATPIGNLKDISPRVTQALCDSDFVLAEDTRVSIKLLSHLGLSKRLVSCHDFNEQKRADTLLSAAQDDQTIALICDAGTPLVSDPGYRVVGKAIEIGMNVIPIPGPSAFLLALVGSGLPCDRFAFEGFLPDKPSSVRRRLADLEDERRTMVFYVAPRKLKKTLSIVAELFAQRPACLARELTKLHEQFLRGTIESLANDLKDWEPRGECVLVLGGNEAADQPACLDTQIEQAIQEQIREGKRMADVAAEVARRFQLKKSDVYKLALGLSDDMQCDNEKSE